MTDPASVVRREVDSLIQTQITTLRQQRPLTYFGRAHFRARSEMILPFSRGWTSVTPRLGNQSANARLPIFTSRSKSHSKTPCLTLGRQRFPRTHMGLGLLARVAISQSIFGCSGPCRVGSGRGGSGVSGHDHYRAAGYSWGLIAPRVLSDRQY